MPSMNTMKVLAIAVVLVILQPPVQGQGCGCKANECCSQWGYCGTTKAYCGTGCQAGNCYSKSGNGTAPNISGIVTKTFFNRILNGASPSCLGKRFYTYEAFINATKSFPNFGKASTLADTKREVAAFLAQVSHETGSLCYIQEIGASHTRYCQPSSKYPCFPNTFYYGRGPFQLTWNYNYIEAGKSLGFDGLRHPDVVAKDPIISFKTALWFWMRNVHQGFQSRGFAASTRAINGGECGGRRPAAVASRVNYYKRYCSQLGVNPGNNLSC